jgi:calcineurin-like phosphoesterase family protein
VIWLTSDPHFFHRNVIRYCNRRFYGGFLGWILRVLTGRVTEAAVLEMNEAIIRNWNAVVSDDDDVYILGDFGMSSRSVEVILPRLKGRKHLILGNHDFPHPAHSKGSKGPEMREKWTKIYLSYGFTSVQLEGELDVPGIGKVRLFHLPYSDPTDTHQDGRPRYFKERLPDDGKPLFCGHVHDKWLFRATESGTSQINVGLDAPGAPWYMRPASLDEVVAEMLEHAKER